MNLEKWLSTQAHANERNGMKPIGTFLEALATLLLIFGGAFAIAFLTGCASNILVSNCREVQVEAIPKSVGFATNNFPINGADS